MKISPRVYKAEGAVARANCIERVIEDIKAASLLGLPFTVQTTHRQAFRNGGNVHKADIYEYRVIIGELTEIDD